MWRWEWECSKDAHLKQKLVTYNAEDCKALERVTTAIAHLCQGQVAAAQSPENTIKRPIGIISAIKSIYDQAHD
jgi:hypothetical protein